MSGLLHPDKIEKMPAVQAVLTHAEATRRIVEENYTHLIDEDKRLTLTVEENVLVQLENLRTHPSVAAALGRKELKLHGWVYEFETGLVFAFDPDHRQFLELTEVSPAATEPDRTLPAT